MTPKEEMIDRIQRALSKEMQFVRESPNKTTEEKVAQIDVLLDTIHFLRDYDKNIKVLKNELTNNKFEKEK